MTNTRTLPSDAEVADLLGSLRPAALTHPGFELGVDDLALDAHVVATGWFTGEALALCGVPLSVPAYGLATELLTCSDCAERLVSRA